LNRQCQNFPTLLSILLLDKGLAVLGDTAPKHGFTALGTPDQVVNNQVDAVFISSVVHVDEYNTNNMEINMRLSVQGRLKPGQVTQGAPGLCRSVPNASITRSGMSTRCSGPNAL
jgi:hypothetical protein